MQGHRWWARGGAAFGIGAVVLMAGMGSVVAAETITTTSTATKHVTVVDRTDLPDLPGVTCGAPAVAPALLSQTSTSSDVITTITTVGPATIFVGEDQQTLYVVAAGEVNFTALTTTTTTLHQTWQGRAAGEPCPTEGHQGITATTASKHVTVVERTDLPDLPATGCGAPAVAPTLVSETSTSDDVTTAIITVGPATIFIGVDQSVEYHVVSGEVDTTTLVTTTTTLHQTYQGTAPGAPCAAREIVAVAPAAITAAPAFTG